MKNERKDRTWKQNGQRSIDFCDYCFKPGCDPMGDLLHIDVKLKKDLTKVYAPRVDVCHVSVSLQL